MLEEFEFDKDLWASSLLQQQQLCKRLGLEYFPPEPNQIIGPADDTSLVPINGLRHPIEQNKAGWYIWSGEYSLADDFFKPIHTYHLLTIEPNLIKYLGLPVVYRFLVDNEGYEDIWFDSSLLNVS